jgi:hypothetical protein
MFEGFMCPKMILLKKLVFVLEMVILEYFWKEHSQGTLGEEIEKPKKQRTKINKFGYNV